MNKMIKGQKGLSLVEVTIMLLVLMLLTSVLAPSIMDFVHDAQWVKVKEDCEAIGISFSRLTRDVGSCVKMVGSGSCTKDNRADVLVSFGSTPTSEPGDYTNANIKDGSVNWNTATNTSLMDDQFVTNKAGYLTPYDKNSLQFLAEYPVGPQFNLGWRGAYLAPQIGPDPWGNRYYVNSVFSSVTTDGNGAYQGNPGNWWENDVFCLSAGPNSIIQTPIAKNAPNYGTDRAADDFVFVIQGSSR